MSLRGSRLFYQTAGFEPAHAEDLESLVRGAFAQLSATQKVATLTDGSEWHLYHYDDGHSEGVFMHLVSMKPGHKMPAYVAQSNSAKIIGVNAGTNAEFVKHDVCCFISGNDVIAYGGRQYDRSIVRYLNSILTHARLIAANQVLIIENVMKPNILKQIQLRGVDEISFDAVTNSQLLDLANQEKSGFIGRILNAPLAKDGKIKIKISLTSDGRFTKSEEQMAHFLLEEAKKAVQGADDDDWDGLAIKLRDGTPVKRDNCLISSQKYLHRKQEVIEPIKAKEQLRQYFEELKNSGQLITCD